MCEPATCLPAGEKGSDASAREAAKKLLASSRQKQALTAVLDLVENRQDSSKAGQPSRSSGSSIRSGLSQNLSRSSNPEPGEHSKAGWAPRNMIVRGAFQELTNMQQ